MLKIIFQVLVMIQVLSFLCTGNGKLGTKLTLLLYHIFQSTCLISFKIIISILKVIYKIIPLKSLYKSATNKQYRKKIRKYNKKLAENKRKVIDLKTYINNNDKQQEKI